MIYSIIIGAGDDNAYGGDNMLKLKYFDKTADGQDVFSVTLTNNDGESCEIISYGATVRTLFIKDKEGVLRDVVLGYDTVADYENNDSYFGAVIGRCANRLTGPSFTINGKEYHTADNTGTGVALHGGNIGFDKKIWTVDLPEANSAAFEAIKNGGEIMSGENSVTFTLLSPDGDEGYPGNLALKVTYTLSDDAELMIDYEAVCDEDTVLNVTNHSYFNLDGQDCGHDCLNTVVRINSDHITPMGTNFAPTGEIMEVADTVFDFNEFKTIGRDLEYPHPQLIIGAGYDHNFVIRRDNVKKKDLSLASQCYSNVSGIEMFTYTDLPGVQFYIGNYIKDSQGKTGARYGRRSGFCFETQFFPNAINTPGFESPLLKKNTVFTSKTVYKFDTV